MAFEFSERHIDEFKTRGYTVFRQIVPPSLIRDLRTASEDARQVAREKGGPQVQRLQPVGAYEIDQRPFVDFSELPELLDAVARVLTPHHSPSNPETCGILLEPAEQPYCTTWHRDGRGPGPHEEWRRLFHHIDFYNQTNCPLYRDSSLWYVPGSHLRPDDFSREAPLDRVWAQDEHRARGDGLRGEGARVQRLRAQHAGRGPARPGGGGLRTVPVERLAPRDLRALHEAGDASRLRGHAGVPRVAKERRGELARCSTY